MIVDAGEDGQGSEEIGEEHFSGDRESVSGDYMKCLGLACGIQGSLDRRSLERAGRGLDRREDRIVESY